MASFWNANSDLDYYDEIHRYDEPSTVESAHGCLKCGSTVSRSFHQVVSVPGGALCRECYFKKPSREAQRRGVA
jgi:hypothetical protein